MTTPLFFLSAPPGDANLAPLQIALEWLTRLNEWHLRRSLRRVEKGSSDTVIPPIYTSGVAYRARQIGRQDWLDVPAVMIQGTGAAEDLAAWRAAELRVSGIAAEPVVAPQWTPQGMTIRCCVRWPDGRIEDPAKIMGGDATVSGSAAGNNPLVHLSLPDTDDGSHFAPLQIMLEGLTKINEWQIRHSLRQAELGNPSAIIPPLYASGVVYREEAPGREDWLDALAVVRQRHADCEDLAAYRTAELRVAGHRVEPVIKWQWIPREMMLQQGYPADKLPGRGVWLVHCCVRWLDDGRIEDPSKILGMGGNFMERI